MTFDPGAQLDPSQVSDRRGMGRSGGLAIGGGGLGLVLVLAYVLLGGNPNDISGLLEPGDVTGAGPESSALATDCRTGEDANAARRLPDPRLRQQHPGLLDRRVRPTSSSRYEPAQDRPVQRARRRRGCGTASAATGPFYCPPDRLVYLDLGFFGDLRSRFGATGGSFAQGYVVAHEYGHHVQDLLGILGSRVRHGRGRRRRLGPDRAPGRLPRRRLGEPRRGRHPRAADRPPQIADGLDAAAAVGDDRIQEAVTGQVDPEAWTHGSSAQRQQWFTIGYQGGIPSDCDTFSGGICRQHGR